MSKWSMSNRQTGTKAAISPIKTNKTRPFYCGRAGFVLQTVISRRKAMDKQKLHELRVFAAEIRLETLKVIA